MIRDGEGSSEATSAMLKAALEEGAEKETGPLAVAGEAGSKISEVAGVLSEHLPGALRAIAIVALAAEFKKNVEQKGLKEALQTLHYRTSDLFGQAPEEDQQMRHELSDWFYKSIGATQDTEAAQDTNAN